MLKKNQYDGGNTIAPWWRQWCHSITAVSASAGSVLLSGLQRAAQAYTCFKDVSWAHPSILVTLHRPPPRTWSLEKNKKKTPPGMCNSLGSSAVFTDPVTQDEISDLSKPSLRRLIALCTTQTPYLQQCRETLTLPTMHRGRERHHHTHSDSALAQCWCSEGWGRGERCGGVGERDGGGHDDTSCWIWEIHF